MCFEQSTSDYPIIYVSDMDEDFKIMTIKIIEFNSSVFIFSVRFFYKKNNSSSINKLETNQHSRQLEVAKNLFVYQQIYTLW